MEKEKYELIVIFARHAESEGNVAGTAMAELEKRNQHFELTPLGHKQSEALAKYVRREHGVPDVVHASTFVRSQQTAHAVAGSSRPVIHDSRLDERFDGVLHSLPTHILQARYQDELDLRKKYGWYHHRPSGGENAPDVEMRIRSFREEIWYKHLHSNIRGARIVFASTHGNWMLIHEGLVHGWTADELNRRKEKDQIPNGCLSVYYVTSPYDWRALRERVVPDPSLISQNTACA